jgi:hypothetical protein
LSPVQEISANVGLGGGGRSQDRTRLSILISLPAGKRTGKFAESGPRSAILALNGYVFSGTWREIPYGTEQGFASSFSASIITMRIQELGEIFPSGSTRFFRRAAGDVLCEMTVSLQELGEEFKRNGTRDFPGHVASQPHQTVRAYGE